MHTVRHWNTWRHVNARASLKYRKNTPSIKDTLLNPPCNSLFCCGRNVSLAKVIFVSIFMSCCLVSHLKPSAAEGHMKGTLPSYFLRLKDMSECSGGNECWSQSVLWFEAFSSAFLSLLCCNISWQATSHTHRSRGSRSHIRSQAVSCISMQSMGSISVWAQKQGMHKLAACLWFY